MPDYDFAGLSPRTFEHYVQALAVAEIGSAVMPFGDGPDGGREATFDGPTSYRTTDAPWEGYGVVQAKFLQRPKTTLEDGRWAMRELRAELDKFSAEDSQRKLPDYYLFVTNVVLSAVPETGSKDRVVEVLSKFARKHDLKGFEVWDYDKLRTLTDNHDSLRRTYAAWITSGDVLTELSQWLRNITPDFDDVILRFTQKELLSDAYARLEQAGHSPDEKIPLAKVFTDLPVSSRPSSDASDSFESASRGIPQVPFIEEMVAAAADPVTDDETIEPESTDQLTRKGRFVLIGGPGQGKTTLAQYLCQLFRFSYLNGVDKRRLSADARRTLVDLKRFAF